VRAAFHINVVLFFEILIPMVAPLLFVFTIRQSSNSMAFIYLTQVFGLYFLGRIIGRNIPATCNTCAAIVKPEGTSVIIYYCKKCGYKYSKRVSSSDDFHGDHD